MLLYVSGPDRGEHAMAQAWLGDGRDFDRLADALIVQHARFHFAEARRRWDEVLQRHVDAEMGHEKPWYDHAAARNTKSAMGDWRTRGSRTCFLHDRVDKWIAPSRAAAQVKCVVAAARENTIV